MSVLSVLNLAQWQQVVVALGLVCVAVAALASALARLVDAIAVLWPSPILARFSSMLHVLGTDAGKAGGILASAQAARMARRKSSGGFAAVDVLFGLAVGMALALLDVAWLSLVGCTPAERTAVVQGAESAVAVVGADACAALDLQPEPGWVYLACAVESDLAKDAGPDGGALSPLARSARVVVKVRSADWQLVKGASR